MPTATLQFMADQLGISCSTVSRVLNGNYGYESETTKRIKNLAQELNYRPNTLAASLRTKQSKIIGLIVPDLGDEFFSRFLKGAEEYLESAGYQLLICQSFDSRQREIEIDKVQR
ncbi:MAG: LacI family DNA-binding transcriptional regulator [Bacteroidota bacterium]